RKIGLNQNQTTLSDSYNCPDLILLVVETVVKSGCGTFLDIPVPKGHKSPENGTTAQQPK
ncbi:hypothetical protein PO909_033038, partial [Leuciscus waleckii]